jgi:hypothetical protein
MSATGRPNERYGMPVRIRRAGVTPPDAREESAPRRHETDPRRDHIRLGAEGGESHHEGTRISPRGAKRCSRRAQP